MADPQKVAALSITDPEKALNAGIMLQKVDADKYGKLWDEVKTMK